MPIKSPYETLGIKPTATDAEIRAAYRRLVQLHHPDHNQNSPESTRRFEEVQEAYAQIQRERGSGPPRHAGAPPRHAGAPPGHAANAPAGDRDPAVDARLEDLEKQVRAAQERARRAAREAAREAAARRQEKRPTDEELGYYTTEDSLTSILADARTQLAQHLSTERVREHPVAKRVADLIEGLEELASKLDRR
jgi:DnaJ-domain-containing protein 1